MAKKKQPETSPTLPGVQPRGVVPPATRDTYRASMHTELQKFGREDEQKQLALFEQVQLDAVKAASKPPRGKTAEAVKVVVGLDLTQSEDKALSAIQKLLDKTNYKGNQPGMEIDSPSFHLKTYVPRLSFTWKEYFEAYGLSEYQERGRQRDEAKEALLNGLTKPRVTCYERRRYEGEGANRKPVADVIRTIAPLVKFYECFEGLSEQEAKKVEAGEAMTDRVTKVFLEVSPQLMDGIDNYFLLKPATLHQEIAQLSAGRPVSRAVSLFAEWLLTLNMATIQIHRDTLATKLRLSRLVKQRKRKELENIIQECLETAKALGYLLSYSSQAGGLLKLQLNPERCLRVKKGKPEVAEAKDEEDSSLPF